MSVAQWNDACLGVTRSILKSGGWSRGFLFLYPHSWNRWTISWTLFVVGEAFPIHPIRVLIILQISGIEVYLGNEILYAVIDRARPAKLSLVLKWNQCQPVDKITSQWIVKVLGWQTLTEAENSVCFHYSSEWGSPKQVFQADSVLMQSWCLNIPSPPPAGGRGSLGWVARGGDSREWG